MLFNIVKGKRISIPIEELKEFARYMFIYRKFEYIVNRFDFNTLPLNNQIKFKETYEEAMTGYYGYIMAFHDLYNIDLIKDAFIIDLDNANIIMENKGESYV